MALRRVPGISGMAVTAGKHAADRGDFGAQNVYLINRSGRKKWPNVLSTGREGLPEFRSFERRRNRRKRVCGIERRGRYFHALKQLPGQMNYDRVSTLTFDPPPQPQDFDHGERPCGQADHSGDAVGSALAARREDRWRNGRPRRQSLRFPRERFPRIEPRLRRPRCLRSVQGGTTENSSAQFDVPRCNFRRPRKRLRMGRRAGRAHPSGRCSYRPCRMVRHRRLRLPREFELAGC